MKRPTLKEGVIVAAAASIAGAAFFGAMSAVFATGAVARLLVAGIGLAYVVYLLSRSAERVGRLTTVAAWFAAAVATWWLAPSFPLYVTLHVCVIWLVRSLYHGSGLLSSLADLGLNALATAAGVSAYLYTQSALLGIWCFFLTQSLFTLIPAAPGLAGAAGPDRFEQAHRTAESALRRLSVP